jgi:hypothetical protein
LISCRSLFHARKHKWDMPGLLKMDLIICLLRVVL